MIVIEIEKNKFDNNQTVITYKSKDFYNLDSGIDLALKIVSSTVLQLNRVEIKDYGEDGDQFQEYYNNPEDMITNIPKVRGLDLKTINIQGYVGSVKVYISILFDKRLIRVSSIGCDFDFISFCQRPAT